jgi:hypothetical protein
MNTWELGSLDVWFKEGVKDANNQHMHDNYFLKKEIVSEFPTFNEREVNPVFTIVFVVLIVLLFILYLVR